MFDKQPYTEKNQYMSSFACLAGWCFCVVTLNTGRMGHSNSASLGRSMVFVVVGLQVRSMWLVAPVAVLCFAMVEAFLVLLAPCVCYLG